MKLFQGHFSTAIVLTVKTTYEMLFPAWKTDYWSSRVLAFLLALSDDKFYLVIQQLYWKDDAIPTYLKFCCALFWEQIDNELIITETVRKEEVRKRFRKGFWQSVLNKESSKT